MEDGKIPLRLIPAALVLHTKHEPTGTEPIPTISAPGSIIPTRWPGQSRLLQARVLCELLALLQTNPPTQADLFWYREQGGQSPARHRTRLPRRRARSAAPYQGRVKGRDALPP